MASDQTKVQLAKFPVAKTGQEAHDILNLRRFRVGARLVGVYYGLGKVPRRLQVKGPTPIFSWEKMSEIWFLMGGKVWKKDEKSVCLGGKDS